MDPRESEYREPLVILRDLFRMTGALHEAQRVQFAYLPRVCIAHSTKADTEIQFTPGDTKKPRIVRIKVQVEGREPRNLDKCLEKLDEWIKFLVGTDFTVVVEYGDKVYRSAGKKIVDGNRTHQAREPGRTPHRPRARGVRAVPPQR